MLFTLCQLNYRQDRLLRLCSDSFSSFLLSPLVPTLSIGSYSLLRCDSLRHRSPELEHQSSRFLKNWKEDGKKRENEWNLSRPLFALKLSVLNFEISECRRYPSQNVYCTHPSRSKPPDALVDLTHWIILDLLDLLSSRSSESTRCSWIYQIKFTRFPCNP